MRIMVVAAVLAGALTAPQPALTATVAAGTSFTCTPVAVWDGDGPIWCAEGPRIRLAGVAAREIDNSCRRYHPCPDASGTAAEEQPDVGRGAVLVVCLAFDNHANTMRSIAFVRKFFDDLAVIEKAGAFFNSALNRIIGT